jgi:hypothetical protein
MTSRKWVPVELVVAVVAAILLLLLGDLVDLSRIMYGGPFG